MGAVERRQERQAPLPYNPADEIVPAEERLLDEDFRAYAEETTRLSTAAYERLLALLKDPPTPNATLFDAVRRQRK